MSFINWGQETPAQLEARRRAEREWQVLVEQAINMRRQQSNSVTGVGGSSKIQVAQNDLISALYKSDGGTWRFLIYNAQKNEVVVDWDTEVGSEEYLPYSLNDLSPIVPVQQKGFFFILAKSLGENNYDIKCFSFNSKGELKDLIEREFNPEGDVGGPAYCDGYGIVNPGQPVLGPGTATCTLFDGEEVTQYSKEVLEGYFAVFSGLIGQWSRSIDNGSIPLIGINVPIGSPPTDFPYADLYVVSPDKTIKKVQDVSFGVNSGPGFLGYQWKGSVLYVIYTDDDGYPTRLVAIKSNGGVLADIDLTATGLAFDLTGPGTAVPYSDNSAQFIFPFFNESLEKGWLLYDFNGDKGTYQSYTIEAGEFENLQVWTNSLDRGDLKPYSESAGILNIFTTGTSFPAVDKATFLYRLTDETSYRRYDFKTESDHPKGILFDPNGDPVQTGIFGSSIVVAVDLGSPSGLTGDMSLVFLGKEVKTVDGQLNYFSNLDEIDSYLCGDYSLVSIKYTGFTVRQGIYVYDKLGNLVDQLVDASDLFDEILTSYDSIFVRKDGGDSYYFNRETKKFELLGEQYPFAVATANVANNQWLTQDGSENGLLLLGRLTEDPEKVKVRVITRNGIGPEFEVYFNGVGLGLLSDYVVSSVYEVNSVNFLRYDFKGNPLDSFVYPYPYTQIDGAPFILNKSNAFFWNPVEKNFLFATRKFSLVDQVLSGGDYVVSAVNDWVWYWNSSFTPPSPPAPGSITINSINYDILGNSTVDFDWAELRTDSDHFFVTIAENEADVLTNPDYINSSNAVTASGGNQTLTGKVLNQASLPFLNRYAGQWLAVSAYDSNGNLVSDAIQIPQQSLPGIKIKNATSLPTGAQITFDLLNGNSQVAGQNIVAEYSPDDFATTAYTSAAIPSVTDGPSQVQVFDQPAGPASFKVRLRLEIPGALLTNVIQNYWYSSPYPILI